MLVYHSLLVVCVSCKINSIAREANFENNGTREMIFISFAYIDDGEHNGVGFVETT